MRRPNGDTNETGAALLTTLLIVAALSAIAVATLEELRRGQRLEANAASLAQAQWYAIGAQDYAIAMASDIRSLGPAPAREPQRFAFPLDHGLMEIEAADASACINVNGVIAGAGDIFQRHETGAAQFEALLQAIGLPGGQSRELTDALIAWMETSDGRTGPSRNDEPYLRQSPAYMTGREPMAEISELRAVRGFTPEIFARLRPFVCVHPNVGPSRINLNALTPDHAPVLTALSEGHLAHGAARALVASRPERGWQDPSEVWGRPDMLALGLPDHITGQSDVTPRYIALSIHVTHLNAEASLTQLLVDRGAGFVPTGRRWSAEP